MKVARLDNLARQDSLFKGGEPQSRYEKRQLIFVENDYDFIGNSATDVTNVSNLKKLFIHNKITYNQYRSALEEYYSTINYNDLSESDKEELAKNFIVEKSKRDSFFSDEEQSEILFENQILIEKELKKESIKEKSVELVGLNNSLSKEDLTKDIINTDLLTNRIIELNNAKEESEIKSSAFEDVLWNNQVHVGGNFIHTQGSSEIILSRSGWHEVSYSITLMNMQNQKTASETRVYLNSGSGYTEVYGSNSLGFHNAIGDGYATLSKKFSLNVSYGDKIKIQVRKFHGNGSLVIVGGASNLTIKKII